MIELVSLKISLDCELAHTWASGSHVGYQFCGRNGGLDWLGDGGRNGSGDRGEASQYRRLCEGNGYCRGCRPCRDDS